MKIAVTTEGSQIFQHFGKCPVFTLYTVSDGQVVKKEAIDASANGHAALTGFLSAAGVDTVVCGGIGEGAKQMLSAAGIRFFSGVTGSMDDAVNSLIAGKLTDLGGSCRHEEHEEGHSCDCKNHCN